MDVMYIDMPATHPRVETGVVQFGTDWPGVFIRGDNALFLSGTLTTVIHNFEETLPSSRLYALQLTNLAQLLRSCMVKHDDA